MTDEKAKSKNGKLLVLVVLIILVGVILLQSRVVQSLDKEYSASAQKKSLLPNASEWDESWAQAYQEMNQGQYAKAEDIVKEALKKAKNKGSKDSRLAAGNDCLALIYKKQGKISEALPLYEKNLASDEASLGKDNPGLSNGLKHIALSKMSKKDYASAVEIYKRVIAMTEKEHGSESPLLAAELRNLIRTYDLQGDYKNAKELAERALRIDMAAYGPTDMVTASDMNNLALINFRLNLIDEAFENAVKALSVSEENKNEAISKVISLNYQYLQNSFEKPYLEGTPDKTVAFPEKVFEEAKTLKNTNAAEAAQKLLDNLETAQKAACGSEQLGRYLVRLNNTLFAQGKDFAAIAFGEVAQKILMKNMSAQLAPSVVNVQSYIAMSYDRLAFKALKEKNYNLYQDLSAKSKENYSEAIRLAKEAPANTVSPAWFKTLNSGLASAEQRMKECQRALSVAKEKSKTGSL